MDELHAKRLLNVARALRESPAPERFTMNCYATCGTPACALGHYAARRDLQRTFRLGPNNELLRSNGTQIDHYDLLVYKHFGLTVVLDDDDASDLFSSDGCGNAQTAIEAAEYIERWVRARAGKAGGA